MASLPKPLVSRRGAGPLGPCRVGNRLIRAAQEQERHGASRQGFVGFFQFDAPLQQYATVDIGALGLALSQLEEGAAQAGGSVAKVFGEQGVVFLTSALDRPGFGVHIGQIEPGGRTVGPRGVQRDQTVVLAACARKVSQFVIEIAHLEMNSRRLGTAREHLESTLHVGESEVPPAFRPIDPGSAEAHPRRLRPQRDGGGVMAEGLRPVVEIV